jgi:hypothetical protein
MLCKQPHTRPTDHKDIELHLLFFLNFLGKVLLYFLINKVEI